MSRSPSPSWPEVRAAVDSDDLTVRITTDVDFGLGGAVAQLGSPREALALAMFVNQRWRGGASSQ